MGFNYGPAAFSNLQAFINAMYQSKVRRLNAFLPIIQHGAFTDTLSLLLKFTRDSSCKAELLAQAPAK